MNKKIITDIIKLLGQENVLCDPATLKEYAVGWWPVETKWALLKKLPHLSEAVVRPSTSQEVLKIVQLANHYQTPITPVGGRSGIVGGTCPEHGGIHLDSKRLTSFEINEIDQTVRVGTGWMGPALEDKLNQKGYTLGHFPQSFHLSSVGGWVATSAIGTFSGKYGKMDDIVIALQVVLPNGEVVETPATPKNSAGPSLRHFFVGSEGTLGFVTEATLRIHRLPEARQFQAFLFPNVEEGLDAIREFVQGGYGPAVVRLYDEHEGKPKLAMFGIKKKGALLILAHDGDTDSVALEIQKTKKSCLKYGAEELTAQIGHHWFYTRYNYAWLEQTNQRKGEVADAIEMAAPWSKIKELYRSTEKVAKKHAHTLHIHFSHFYPTEASMYLIFIAKAATDEASIPLYQKTLHDVMETCVKAGGSISHHHGVGIAKRAWMKKETSPGGMTLLKALKRSIDPHQIMNSGKLGI